MRREGEAAGTRQNGSPCRGRRTQREGLQGRRWTLPERRTILPTRLYPRWLSRLGSRDHREVTTPAMAGRSARGIAFWRLGRLFWVGMPSGLRCNYFGWCICFCGIFHEAQVRDRGIRLRALLTVGGTEGIGDKLRRDIVWKELGLSAAMRNDNVDSVPGNLAGKWASAKCQGRVDPPVVDIEGQAKAPGDIESQLGITAEVVWHLNLIDSRIELNKNHALVEEGIHFLKIML